MYKKIVFFTDGFTNNDYCLIDYNGYLPLLALTARLGIRGHWIVKFVF